MTALALSTYPVGLAIERPAASNRFWAIPILGILVKAIILIPHFILLYLLGFVLAISHLVIWIGVLFAGRLPDWAFGLNAGYLRWTTRVQLYLYGLTDAYPAFSTNAEGDIVIERPETSSRFFAIPLIGILVKWIILIPHFIILYALGVAVSACQLVIWIGVLFGGEYPQWAFTLVGGTVLWGVRVYAYLLGLTDQYPPFGFA